MQNVWQTKSTSRKFNAQSKHKPTTPTIRQTNKISFMSLLICHFGCKFRRHSYFECSTNRTTNRLFVNCLLIEVDSWQGYHFSQYVSVSSKLTTLFGLFICCDYSCVLLGLNSPKTKRQRVYEQIAAIFIEGWIIDTFVIYFYCLCVNLIPSLQKAFDQTAKFGFGNVMRLKGIIKFSPAANIRFYHFASSLGVCISQYLCIISRRYAK